jgi:sec-independent protein translocase protein TatA
MFGLGTWEILLILIAALVFIGPSKLPSLARTMGKGMRDVRRAMAGFEDEVRQASTIPEADAPHPAVSEAPDNGVPIPRTDAKTANAPPPDEASTDDDALTEGGDSDSDSESDNQHV